MLFFREVSHLAGNSFLFPFVVVWVPIHNIFSGWFLSGFLFLFAFRFQCGCGWLRVVMQNPSQVCLASCVVHGVTCEVHELAFWENLGFSMGGVL